MKSRKETEGSFSDEVDRADRISMKPILKVEESTQVAQQADKQADKQAYSHTAPKSGNGKPPIGDRRHVSEMVTQPSLANGHMSKSSIDAKQEESK